MSRRNLDGMIAAIEALAATQLGLFTLAQARSWGLARQRVSYHSGPARRWQRVFPEVYQLTGLEPDPTRIMLAAQLWGGPGAVLSHHAAAIVLGLDGIRDAVPEIWSGTAGATKGIIVHKGTVAERDIVTRGPLRHTSPVRTASDLATVLDGELMEIVVESVLRRNPRWERQFLEFAESGRRGCHTLRRVLTLRGPGTPPTDSELETRYIQLMRTANVPPPTRQFRVINDRGRVLGRLDLCWPDAKLWVELDSRAWHDRPEALFRDRERQNDVVVELDWLPLRFTWHDVLGRPADTAAKTEAVYWRRLASLPGARRPEQLARQVQSARRY